MENKKNYNLDCSVAKVLNIIGDKWTLLIIFNIIKGAETFKDLKDSLNNIPTNLLSNRLKMLEENGIIKSEMYSKHPPRYTYTTTEKGNNLKLVIYSLIFWGSKNLCNCNTKMFTKDNNELEIVFRDTINLEINDFDDIVIKKME